MRGEEGCGCRVLGLRVSARWGGGGLGCNLGALLCNSTGVWRYSLSVITNYPKEYLRKSREKRGSWVA